MGLISQTEKRKMLLLQAAKICGSQAAFAKKIGVSRHHYNEYLNGIKKMPLHHAINIQIATNGKIRAKDIVMNKYNTSKEYRKAVDAIESWSSKIESCSDYLVMLDSINTDKNPPCDPFAIPDYYFNLSKSSKIP